MRISRDSFDRNDRFVGRRWVGKATPFRVRCPADICLDFDSNSDSSMWIYFRVSVNNVIVIRSLQREAVIVPKNAITRPLVNRCDVTQNGMNLGARLSLSSSGSCSCRCHVVKWASIKAGNGHPWFRECRAECRAIVIISVNGACANIIRCIIASDGVVGVYCAGSVNVCHEEAREERWPGEGNGGATVGKHNFLV